MEKSRDAVQASQQRGLTVRICIRVDGSSQIGLGHIMRCITLAKQFGSKAEIDFLCGELPVSTLTMIKHAGFNVITLLLPTDAIENQQLHAQHCLSLLDRKYDLLIVDHYLLGREFTAIMRTAATVIMVIDDLANRKHDCDLLLDQNLYENLDSRYTGLVPEYCTMLLGPKYVLLRQEFYNKQNIARQPQHILVCFGGSDTFDLTSKVTNILNELKLLPFTADIVVGAGYDSPEKIEAITHKSKKMRLHVNATNMASLMQRANIMIGAGGSMHWERCVSGVAGVVITTAENQVETTRYLSQKKGCIWLSEAAHFDSFKCKESIKHALTHPEQMRDLANNASALVGNNTNANLVSQTIRKVIRGKHATN